MSRPRVVAASRRGKVRFMRRHRQDRETRDDPLRDDQRRLRRFRVCLIGSIIFYIGLARLTACWLPGEPMISWVLIFFGAHSAAYLVAHELRGRRDHASL
jgi:hypothetical protein